MRRRIVKALAAIGLLLAVAALSGYAYLRRSLPSLDGTESVAGISGPVEIVRDADAIPHVYASTDADALFGLGYVHGQDRLWQMEFQRRIGNGRLSEIFGAVTIPQDRFLRTVGFGRAARSAWEHLSEPARRQIDAYVAGVNAFIAGHRGSRLPPEFLLLGVEPEPWQGVDVIVWAKMMAYDLAKNYTFELLRDDLTRVVGDRATAELLPPYATDGLSIVGDHELGRSRAGHVPSPSATARSSSGPPGFGALVSALADGNPSVSALLLGAARGDALGSNSWVIDGTLTASGQPLLANDPHLDAHVPSTWYLAGISGGDLESIGATLPGTPVVAIGRNRRIAWSETNLPADVEDLYRERLDSTGRFAEYRGVMEPLQIITETINVKGAEPLVLTVRRSRHGPLISDAINANNAALKRAIQPAPIEPLALRWTALDPDDTTIEAFLALNRARNWQDFKEAMRRFVVPPQNVVYADVDGHIGYYGPGRVPLRASGDGSRPAEGWTGDAEWTGWVPFDELPHTYDPAAHFIVTANHRPVPADYTYQLGSEWTEPFRARRITDLLMTAPRATPNDFAAIQGDRYSLHAADLVPLLTALARPAARADARAVEILQQWNMDARGDSAAAAIFQAWFQELTPALVEDKLGPNATADYLKADRTSYVARFVANTLRDADSPWCDDRRTPARETCGDIVSRALHDAVADLTRRLGGDMSRWRWDAVHQARFPHQGLDAVAALRPLLSRSVPSAGDWSSVNVGPVAADSPYEQRAVPGYRQIVDLSPSNDSRFLDAVGESGHPFSPHYDDFMADWRAVRYRKMRMERQEIEKGAIGHLRLVPIR